MMAAIAIAIAGVWSSAASAHCDAMDGPVVSAAREALSTGQVERVLIWVRKDDERAVRTAFEKARKARPAGAQPDSASDRAFYATLVRVHRQGEGEAFTGLKPAGTIAPLVAAADQAIASGHPEALEQEIVGQTRASLRERYDAAASRRKFDVTDVDAGRAYVGAYVSYVHHVERLHVAATAGNDHGHAAATATAKRDSAGPAAAPSHAH
jgi:hypothetical protein